MDITESPDNIAAHHMYTALTNQAVQEKEKESNKFDIGAGRGIIEFNTLRRVNISV